MIAFQGALKIREDEAMLFETSRRFVVIEMLPDICLLQCFSNADAMASGELSSSGVAYGSEAFAVSGTMYLTWPECSDIDVDAIETLNSEQ